MAKANEENRGIDAWLFVTVTKALADRHGDRRLAQEGSNALLYAIGELEQIWLSLPPARLRRKPEVERS